MTDLFKCLLIATVPIYITGCSTSGPLFEAKHISPLTNVSLEVGESVIVHGAIDQCRKDSLRWSDVSLQVPNSKTGFFSNGGYGVIDSKRCGGITPALQIRFTANQTGSERLIVAGDPVNIVVTNQTAANKTVNPPGPITFDGSIHDSVSFDSPAETGKEQ